MTSSSALVAARSRWCSCALGAPTCSSSPVLQRENYRGHKLATAGGILSCSPCCVVEAGRALLGARGVGNEPGSPSTAPRCCSPRSRSGCSASSTTCSGGDERRGFKGHVGALFQGRITTGFLKLFGGAGVAVVLVATPGFARGRRLLVGRRADRARGQPRATCSTARPGRTIKCALVAYRAARDRARDESRPGSRSHRRWARRSRLLPDDLGERLMLGDSGANVIGAVLGLGVVLGRGETTRVTALVIVIVLTILAEVVSFSKVIDRVPFLRALDRAGTTPERKAA
jgi:hypothetical protein